MSGGKDSTIVYNLAMIVATEKNRLPLKVFFLDQEAEWQAVIDYIETIMYDPRVDPYWLQVPIKLFNATSTSGEDWLECWKPGETWMREKDPISIKENNYGTDRFKDLCHKFSSVAMPEGTINLTGVRCEESPGRELGLCNAATYKWITFGKVTDKAKNQYNFCPIYDWRYTDVWKAIFENKWEYCRIYDHMYSQGVPVPKMRVSNLHHETSIASLYYLQEIEPDTWNKLTERLEGINTAGQLKADAFAVTTLPHMFESWKEYRDHLLKYLITNEDHKAAFQQRFDRFDKKFHSPMINEAMCKAAVSSILTNDYHFTKLDNWTSKNDVKDWLSFQKGKQRYSQINNKFIADDYERSKGVTKTH
jgi:predicted phosphoadenosine phosphosulfate sulfurtransferase